MRAMGNAKSLSDAAAAAGRKSRRRAARRTVEGIECPIGKREAAEILGISEDTLDRWTVRYGIRHLKYDMPQNGGNRGKVLYLPSDLLEFRNRFVVEGRQVAEEVERMIAEAGTKR